MRYSAGGVEVIEIEYGYLLFMAILDEQARVLHIFYKSGDAFPKKEVLKIFPLLVEHLELEIPFLENISYRAFLHLERWRFFEYMSDGSFRILTNNHNPTEDDILETMYDI